MKKYVPYMMAGGLIAALMLGGCSSNTETTAATGADSQAAQSPTDQGGQAAMGQNGMNRANMSFGKIKSISGSTITLYTAEMPAGRMQNAGEGEAPDSSAAPGDGGRGGQAPEGQGTPPSGAPEGGGQGGAQGSGGGMRGGGMMQNFSEETTDITVGSDTQIVSVTFDNGSQQETALSLSDLKADDIIQYTLKTDTAEAEKITLSTGNFGGRGEGGGAGSPSGGAQGTDTSGS
ncbi:hypothetical protein [Paenibacillus sp. S150]|uniref:hypothetical protein n=1 Tax=Paenibacillus sp. S150 TaxID=2749826 RepID=UPI001C58D355|nr:hypothetical protein [Paenibacillus sp. S150]MBW4082385.1 hypothetical protein [Paenibacillus sp. S150]